MKSRRNLALVPVFLACLSRSAFAQGDKATAEALFSEGRRLMTARDFVAACDKFAASQKLDPALGTSLNLADCYEKSGRTASAWAEFRDAAGVARATGSKEREQVARHRVAALEKGLARLTLKDPMANPDLHIVRDGAPVDRAVLGTAVPVDPGAHVVEVAAPGKKKWSTRVDVRAGAQLVVDIPELAIDVADERPARPAGSGTQSGQSQRVVGVVVSGVGLVGLAVGSIFGLQAMSKWGDAKDRCGASYPNQCGDEGVKLGNDASQAAMLSTVGFAVGVVGVVAGAAVWFTAPTGKETAGRVPLRVGFDGQRVLVGGTFE